jgi:hypothetical protein
LEGSEEEPDRVYSDYEDEYDVYDDKYQGKSRKTSEKAPEATYEDVLKIQLKRTDAENWNTAPFFEKTAKGTRF